MLFPLLLVGMLVFIFWSSRSQQKKQDAAISQLKKGDRVVTQSGLDRATRRDRAALRQARDRSRA